MLKELDEELLREFLKAKIRQGILQFLSNSVHSKKKRDSTNFKSQTYIDMLSSSITHLIHHDDDEGREPIHPALFIMYFVKSHEVNL